MGRDRNGIGTGLLLITIGLIFFIDRQGYGGFHNLWPLILIVMGLSRLLFPRDRSIRTGVVVVGRRGCRNRHDSRYGGLWLVMLGLIFLMNENGILSIHQSWPLFIVAAGLGVVFSGMFPNRTPDANDSTIGQGGQS
jgi:hypothetical protein